jgi:hypothetical protein
MLLLLVSCAILCHMNRAQKTILAILALADLLVIGLLGSYVLLDMRRGHDALNAPTEPDPACADDLLRTFEATLVDPQDSVIVGWSGDRGAVSITLVSSNREGSSETESLSGDTSSRLTLPLEPTPQLLWVALDALAAGLPDTCPTPETFVLSVSIRTRAGAIHYVVEAEGKYLQAWRQGTIDDQTFAKVARYRSIDTPVLEQ